MIIDDVFDTNLRGFNKLKSIITRSRLAAELDLIRLKTRIDLV